MRSPGKRSRQRKSGRKRIGQVSFYKHHGGWHIYYRDGSRQVRRRAGDTEETASQVAAQVNAQLAVAAPTLFSFSPLSVPELRRKFLDHHEHVIRSSLATVIAAANLQFSTSEIIFRGGESVRFAFVAHDTEDG